MKRSDGNDISEIFGYTAGDTSQAAVDHFQNKKCPFVNSICTKTNHDQTKTYGVCSVANGIGNTRKEVIVCPKRLYFNNYEILRLASVDCWGEHIPFVIGGNLSFLREEVKRHRECVVGFGQASGTEIQVRGSSVQSMDWVLQRYETIDGKTLPKDFIGIEVQSIDITGNYRDCWQAYANLKEGHAVESIPRSMHGLNWANVHKRLIPQIIRKGNIYAHSKRCLGFFFFLPETVFERFERVLGDEVEYTDQIGSNIVSIYTFALNSSTPVSGTHNEIRNVKKSHITLASLKEAFITHGSTEAADSLDATLLAKL